MAATAEPPLAMEEETDCDPPRQRIRTGGEALDERRRVMEREYRHYGADLLVELERPGSAGRQQGLQKRPVGFFRGSPEPPKIQRPPHRLARRNADFDLSGGERSPEQHQHRRIELRRAPPPRRSSRGCSSTLGAHRRRRPRRRAASDPAPRRVRTRRRRSACRRSRPAQRTKCPPIISSKSASSGRQLVGSRAIVRRPMSTSRKSVSFGPARRFRRVGLRRLLGKLLHGIPHVRRIGQTEPNPLTHGRHPPQRSVASLSTGFGAPRSKPRRWGRSPSFPTSGRRGRLSAPPYEHAEARSGWLVPQSQAAALADAVEQALALGASARDAIRRRSRARIAEAFSIERMTRDTLSVYAEALGR